MSKLELFAATAIGFFIFEILFMRIGYFLGFPITHSTLTLSLFLYSVILAIAFTLLEFRMTISNRFITLGGFLAFCLFLVGISALLSYTYDVSWDGQGYHQSAVIGLANHWNPVRQSSLNLKQYLPSQIFAEGYPSSLWEVEASIYAVTDRINTAKVVNIAIAVIAGCTLYSLFRKLSFSKVLASFISILIVLQPVYMLQVMTFMQDGFGYELLVIAVSSLIICMIAPPSYWAIVVFLSAELLLVTTKYSHLPGAFILGIIFILFMLNNFLNRMFVLNRITKIILCGLAAICFIFAYLPYIRNQLMYGSILYPTNLPNLSGSVKFNNVPNNLRSSNKLTLLFYGIFSKSQSIESGDPTGEENVAELKVPFTFSTNEVRGSGLLFNNRVGAGGPLFSGIVILSLMYLAVMSFQAKKRQERYAIYISYFSLGVIILLALSAPTPNLLRYVNELLLIPFGIIIPIAVIFKKRFVKIVTLTMLLLIGTNSALYSVGVVEKNLEENIHLNNQFNQMKSSGIIYQVRAQQFYSSYILMVEKNIPFVAVDRLKCQNAEKLISSSTTTEFCAL